MNERYFGMSSAAVFAAVYLYQNTLHKRRFLQMNGAHLCIGHSFPISRSSGLAAPQHSPFLEFQSSTTFLPFIPLRMTSLRLVADQFTKYSSLLSVTFMVAGGVWLGGFKLGQWSQKATADAERTQRMIRTNLRKASSPSNIFSCEKGK